MRMENFEYSRFVTMMGEKHQTPAHSHILAEKVIRRVNAERERRREWAMLINIVLGWTMIGWVRRSMAVVSLVLVGLFVYQQHEIISGIREIDSRIKYRGFEVGPSAAGGPEPGIVVMTSRLMGTDSIKVSANDIERLLESYNELELSWQRINRVLQRNPQLLRRIEKEYGESLESLRYRPKI